MRAVGTLFAGLVVLVGLVMLTVYIVHVSRVATQAIHEQQQLYEKARYLAEHANITGNTIVLPEPADVIIIDASGVPHVAMNVTTVTLPWPADQSKKIYVAKRGRLRVGVADPVATALSAAASVAAAPLTRLSSVASAVSLPSLYLDPVFGNETYRGYVPVAAGDMGELLGLEGARIARTYSNQFYLTSSWSFYDEGIILDMIPYTVNITLVRRGASVAATAAFNVGGKHLEFRGTGSWRLNVTFPNCTVELFYSFDYVLAGSTPYVFIDWYIVTQQCVVVNSNLMASIAARVLYGYGGYLTSWIVNVTAVGYYYAVFWDGQDYVYGTLIVRGDGNFLLFGPWRVVIFRPP